VDRPEQANLSSEARHVLRILSRKRRFSIGIISGRALNDLRNRVDVKGIIYAGNHGLEIKGPGMEFIHPLTDEIGSVINVLGKMLSKSFGKMKGTVVEDKGLTLSVHYRQAEDEETEHKIKDAFERVVGVARTLGKVRTTSGKKVYEVRPNVPWHKGKATKFIMKRYAKSGRTSGLLPIYVGDDLTDEDAFKVIEGYGGISIYVGSENPQSAASYRLDSPVEVTAFMRRLLMIESRATAVSQFIMIE
jgi:trehalose 6-phosphate phosphatase